MKIGKQILYFLIISFISLSFYSLFIEPDRLEVNHYTLQDSDLKGVKIVFAGDFHVKPHQKRKISDIVSLINQEKSDIVLFVGDFVSGHNEKMTMPMENIAKELGKINAKYGIYTVLGNHDVWYGAEKITELLHENGIRVLANENIKVRIKDKTVFIAGIKDLLTEKPDISKALEHTKVPVILLSHSPDIFPELKGKVNLILAGHTHGGQVRIPFWGPIVTSSQYGSKYSQGLIEENGMRLITTRGIGTSLLPIRFACVPEIIVIEFE